MNKKIKALVLSGVIFTNLVASYPAFALKGELVQIGSEVAETVLIPYLGQIAREDKASAGADIENFVFMPPSFHANKFYITSFNYFDRNSSNALHKVKIYTAQNPNNPVEYNLKSGEMISVNIGFDQPEYIFEFYEGNSTQPFDKYYLSRGIINQQLQYNNFYGISLSQNKNIFYLEKETRHVLNKDLIEFSVTDKVETYLRTHGEDSDYERAINANFPGNQGFYIRKSKKIDKTKMSASGYDNNSKIVEKLKEWQNPNYKYVNNVQKNIEMINLGNSLVAAFSKKQDTPKPITITPDNTAHDAASITSLKYGLSRTDSISYKVPIFKSGYYKIKCNVSAPFSLNNITSNELITSRAGSDEEIYTYLESGYNVLQINNCNKFEQMSIEYISSKENTSSVAVDLKNPARIFWIGSENEKPTNTGSSLNNLKKGSFLGYNVNAPEKGKYLAILKVSNKDASSNVKVENLTNHYVRTDYEPVPNTENNSFKTMNAGIVELEKGTNKLKIISIEGNFDIGEIVLYRMNK